MHLRVYEDINSKLQIFVKRVEFLESSIGVFLFHQQYGVIYKTNAVFAEAILWQGFYCDFNFPVQSY